MMKIILWSLLFVLLSGNKIKDITGKWQVEKVTIGKMPGKATDQQQVQFKKMVVDRLTNAVFNFKADHHFSVSADFFGMPQNTRWEYDEAQGLVKVREYNDPKSRIMDIAIEEKEGVVFFALAETSIVLRMKKRAN